MSRLSLHTKTAVIELKKAGLTHRAISKQLGFNRRSIDRFVQRYEETGETTRKAGVGRPRLSSYHQDAILEELALQN